MKKFRNQIIKELSNAKKSIKVAVSWVTDPILIDVLTRRALAKVNVEVIMSADEWNILRFYEFKNLQKAGGIIKKFGPRKINQDDFMHCKYAIIDGKTTIEGSYNWSKNAQKNREQMRIDSNHHRSEELLNDFHNMLHGSRCYFTGINNPDKIINNLEPLEQKNVQPDSFDRIAYDLKIATAGIINQGEAMTTSEGKIVTNSNVNNHKDIKPNKKHRFYGGNSIQFFRKENSIREYSTAAFQKYHLDKSYNFIKSKIRNNTLVSIGNIQPEGCESYKFKIEWMVGNQPKVTILSKEIAPHNDIHMYDDGSLCLFYPPDLKWKNHFKIADYIIPWIAEWIVFYELYLVTNKWLGPEAPHSIIENN